MTYTVLMIFSVDLILGIGPVCMYTSVCLSEAKIFVANVH